MNTVNTCPCCSTPLLHHFGDRREYWFCRHCWQEMPSLENNRHQEDQKDTSIVNLSIKLPIHNRLVLAS